MIFALSLLALSSFVSASVSELFNTASYKALNPENVEFDPLTKTLVFGSTTRGGIYRAVPTDPFNPVTIVQPSQMAMGNTSFGVTGLKLRSCTNKIYALVVYNMPNFAALCTKLMVFDGATGATLNSVTLNAPTALFNDLFIDEDNKVIYVTQSLSGGQLIIYDLESLSVRSTMTNALFAVQSPGNQSPVGMDGVVYDSTCKVILAFNVMNQTLLRINSPLTSAASSVSVVPLPGNVMIDGMILQQSGFLIGAGAYPSDTLYAIRSTDCWQSASVTQRIVLSPSNVLVDVTLDSVSGNLYVAGDRVYKMPLNDLLKASPNSSNSTGANLSGLAVSGAESAAISTSAPIAIAGALLTLLFI